MKYIDAEKLTKAIEDKGLDCSFALKMERLDTLALIDELQQEHPQVADASKMEQTEQTCKTCGFYENNCPFIRGKLIPYPNKVCKDYTYSARKEQEQPEEVELEKEVSKWWDASFQEPDFKFRKHRAHIVSNDEIIKLARHFYELGKNAK